MISHIYSLLFHTFPRINPPYNIHHLHTFQDVGRYDLAGGARKDIDYVTDHEVVVLGGALGGVKDSLVSPVRFPFESNRWYTVRMTCEYERVRCYVDGVLLHEVDMRPIPSLVSVATLDKENRVIYLKVVNTTRHEEKTSLRIEGVNIRNQAELIQLRGEPEARNTFENPGAVTPVTEPIVFPMSGPLIYNFPPNSVTILKLYME